MRTFRIGTAVILALCAAFLTFEPPLRSLAARQSCGVSTFASNGVVINVLLAKNGAVQQYLIAVSAHNQEHDHDALMAAERQYGPEAINAPPLRVTSFKRGDGGMMIPGKAMDSCGRVTRFH